jgi:hypothetical protein
MELASRRISHDLMFAQIPDMIEALSLEVCT